MKKAVRDIRMAELAIGDEMPLWDQACFHSQQAAEKALKAVLVARGHAVPRSHDLVLLSDKVADLLPDLAAVIDALAVLNQFGVTPRYPSWLAEETRSDAVEALGTARLVVNSVLELLG